MFVKHSEVYLKLSLWTLPPVHTFSMRIFKLCVFISVLLSKQEHKPVQDHPDASLETELPRDFPAHVCAVVFTIRLGPNNRILMGGN